jgi:hypothetical protein
MNKTLELESWEGGEVIVDTDDSLVPLCIADEWMSITDVRTMISEVEKVIGRPEGSAEVSDSFNEAVMQLAAKFGRTVYFSYAKGKGDIIEHRQLEPAVMREVKGNKIVVGHDPERDEPRSYRLDRVKGVISFA